MKKSWAKRISLLGIAMAFFLSQLFSQSYIKFGGGYGFDFGGRLLTEKITSTATIYNSYVDYGTQHDAGYCSFGKGIIVEGSYGYLFSPNIGCELGISYSFGSERDFGSTYSYTFVSSSGSNYTTQVAEKYVSSFLIFKPSVVLCTSSQVIDPYLKFGGVVSMPKVSYDYKRYSFGGSNPPAPMSYTNVYSGNMGFGLNGALGLKYFATEHFVLSAEYGFITFSWAPSALEQTGPDGVTKKYELTESYTDQYRDNSNGRVPAQSKVISDRITFSAQNVTFSLQTIF